MVGTPINHLFINQNDLQMNFLSFTTLRLRMWLNDEVINYMTKWLLQPISTLNYFYSS